jgi:hypothetical protein
MQESTVFTLPLELLFYMPVSIRVGSILSYLPNLREFKFRLSCYVCLSFSLLLITILDSKY